MMPTYFCSLETMVAVEAKTSTGAYRKAREHFLQLLNSKEQVEILCEEEAL